MSWKTLFLSGAIAVSTILTSIQKVEAYEIRKLKGDGERIGVIVLAYNDNWTSWAGEWIFDKYLRLLMGKRYDSLYISRGKELVLDDVRLSITDALATGRHIDFMTSTHSGAESFSLGYDQWVRPDEVFAGLLDEETSTRLDVSANFGCDSVPQNEQYLGMGFKTYLGHEGISVGAIAMRSFLRQWLKKCNDIETAVGNTNTNLNELFDNSIGKWLFQKISGEDEYLAVLNHFGANEDLCR